MSRAPAPASARAGTRTVVRDVQLRGRDGVPLVHALGRNAPHDEAVQGGLPPASRPKDVRVRLGRAWRGAGREARVSDVRRRGIGVAAASQRGAQLAFEPGCESLRDVAAFGRDVPVPDRLDAPDAAAHQPHNAAALASAHRRRRRHAPQAPHRVLNLLLRPPALAQRHQQRAEDAAHRARGSGTRPSRRPHRRTSTSARRVRRRTAHVQAARAESTNARQSGTGARRVRARLPAARKTHKQTERAPEVRHPCPGVCPSCGPMYTPCATTHNNFATTHTPCATTHATFATPYPYHLRRPPEVSATRTAG